MMLISEDINNSEMKFILILPVDYKSWRQFIYLSLYNKGLQNKMKVLYSCVIHSQRLFKIRDIGIFIVSVSPDCIYAPITQYV